MFASLFYLQISNSRSFCVHLQGGHHGRQMRENRYAFLNSTLNKHICITSSASIVRFKSSVAANEGNVAAVSILRISYHYFLS